MGTCEGRLEGGPGGVKERQRDTQPRGQRGNVEGAWVFSLDGAEGAPGKHKRRGEEDSRPVVLVILTSFMGVFP